MDISLAELRSGLVDANELKLASSALAKASKRLR